jgi:hypothetical protein
MPLSNRLDVALIRIPKSLDNIQSGDCLDTADVKMAEPPEPLLPS